MGITLASKTKEIVSILVGALGQQVPVNNRSFLYQLSVSFASLFVSIDKKAKLSVRENLATSATVVGLTEIGRAVLGREPYSAINAEVTFVLPYLTGGVVVAPLTQFISEETGLTYETQETFISPNDPIPSELFYLTARCVLGGADTNTTIGTAMILGTPITGLESNGVVTAVPVVGVDTESIEEYRAKILNAERSQGGGSNAWDYRIWAEEAQGVKRAYPYGGLFNESGSNYGGPSSRTVFVQCSDDIDPDGIAPQYILDDVRSRLITDPENGRNRICMGVPNDTLAVESVRRITFDVRVYGSSIEWSAEAIQILDLSLRNYFFDLLPAVDGVDPQSGRTNVISEVAISNVVHGVLIQYGYSASKVEFSFSGSVDVLGKYALPAGGLAKLITISYPS